ncbi:hypothetical protein PPYR_02951 [Photinus pyralis]|uniref:Uncharacterized protein n=2 Tax=Photinus pyralis TaxID=7054 RepID=A0A1Y1M0C1_PHOPY|nr:uncharacterized protein LOC116162440 [Photinus pyralis]KAB0791151.1 hypothetical protein PPYR_02951 [Photinus pyralis]
MSPICVVIQLLFFVTVKCQDLDGAPMVNESEPLESNYTSHANGTDYQNPNEDNCCTTSLILKFFSLIIGGLMVFTLVYLLIQCCHDNKHVSFARVRTNRAPPCAIFMENFQSNTTLIPNEKQSKKYVLPYDDSLEYIDNEPLHTYDFPMLSPLSKGDKK